MTRVIHITTVHPADDVRILTKECAALAAAGYEVILLAQNPRHEITEIPGVRLVTLPTPRNRLARVTFTAWTAIRTALRTKAVICHFHDPELIPIGILLKLCRRIVIYDVHEDLPQQIRDKHWIPRILRAPTALIAFCAEAIAGQVFDAIVTVTPTIAARFPSESTVLVRNLPILAELLSPSRLELYPARESLVAYVGGITNARGARQMVEATGLLRRTPQVTLVLAGRPQPAGLVDELALIPGWDRVRATGWIGRAEVADLLGCARIGIVTLLPTANYLKSYPTKLFEYMAAGLPVVASDFPVWRDIVDGAKCGLLVDPSDPSAIAQAIDTLLSDPLAAETMGMNGQRAVIERYSWEAEQHALVGLYQRLLAPATEPGSD